MIPQQQLSAHIQQLHDAIDTFEKAITQASRNDLERDGVIQRFEYTLELTRKTIKKVLIYQWIEAEHTPRQIIKTAQKANLLNNADIRFDFIDIRNTLSHVYNSTKTDELFEYIKDHHTVFRKLANRVESSLS